MVGNLIISEGLLLIFIILLMDVSIFNVGSVHLLVNSTSSSISDCPVFVVSVTLALVTLLSLEISVMKLDAMLLLDIVLILLLALSQ